MKTFYFLLLTLFSVNGAFAQWVSQNSGTGKNLYSVHFTDTNTGWAVGDSGTIVHTSDGGLNWAPQNSNTSFDIKSVFFTDADHGYAVGNPCIILKTNDGGSTWTDTSYAMPDYMYEMKSIHFTDASTGYIFGYQWSLSLFVYESMFILKTSDSGANWNLVFSGGDCTEGCNEGSMFFSSPDTAYIIHNEQRGSTTAQLFITTDSWATSTVHNIAGGRRWGGLTSVFFIGATGYAIGPGGGLGGLFKSIDGGVTWTKLNGFGNSLFFTNANDGWIVGNAGTILSSTDGGANWATQNSSTTMNLKSVYFNDQNTGYAVGDGGIIVKTNFGITGLSELHQTENILKVYPNPTSTYVNIETTIKGHLAILNLNGQQLLEQEITVPMTTIDVSKLVSGIYVLMAVEENDVRAGKFIKQ